MRWLFVLPALLMASACYAGSPPVQPPPIREVSELVAPFISPLPGGERPPIGTVDAPGRRAAEPTWKMIAPDGRKLAYSQAQGETVALIHAAELLDVETGALQIVTTRLLYLYVPGRDVLAVTIDVAARPLDNCVLVLVDMNSGEVIPQETLQMSDLDAGWYAGQFGKFSIELYEALERAEPDARLAVEIGAIGPDQEAINAELVQLFPEFSVIYERTGSFRLPDWIGFGGDSDLHLTDGAIRLWRARTAEALEPIVQWLESEGLPYRVWEASPHIRTLLTAEQAVRLAQMEQVIRLTYSGSPDPNIVDPTPTPLPAPWREIPFTTLEEDWYGISGGAESIPPMAGVIRNYIDVTFWGGRLPDVTLFKLNQLDFHTQSAVVVYRGRMGGQCYPTQITKLATDGESLAVHADLYIPAGACTAAESAPYHVVLVSSADLPPSDRPDNMSLLPIVFFPTEKYGEPWP